MSVFVAMELAPIGFDVPLEIEVMHMLSLYNVTVAALFRVKATVGETEVPGDVVVTLTAENTGPEASLV